eukprot:TRINITY_DN3562_c0_g7_i1.p1 TRINITY_DN3562_c0_g7~~TRINITY_DN3562_c0_g7_i1.p1  ORF type:complete len:544 (-),score=112.90 TRINITY_DN3562_c0_g7_i1:784-2256(-)
MDEDDTSVEGNEAILIAEEKFTFSVHQSFENAAQEEETRCLLANGKPSAVPRVVCNGTAPKGRSQKRGLKLAKKAKTGMKNSKNVLHTQPFLPPIPAYERFLQGLDRAMEAIGFPPVATATKETSLEASQDEAEREGAAGVAANGDATNGEVSAVSKSESNADFDVVSDADSVGKKGADPAAHSAGNSRSPSGDILPSSGSTINSKATEDSSASRLGNFTVGPHKYEPSPSVLLSHSPFAALVADAQRFAATKYSDSSSSLTQNVSLDSASSSSSTTTTPSTSTESFSSLSSSEARSSSFSFSPSSPPSSSSPSSSSFSPSSPSTPPSSSHSPSSSSSSSPTSPSGSLSSSKAPWTSADTTTSSHAPSSQRITSPHIPRHPPHYVRSQSPPPSRAAPSHSSTTSTPFMSSRSQAHAGPKGSQQIASSEDSNNVLQKLRASTSNLTHNMGEDEEKMRSEGDGTQRSATAPSATSSATQHHHLTSSLMTKLI